MNGYLVMLSHTLDDLPVALFASAWDAQTFAENIKPDDGKSVGKLLQLDATTPVCVKVLTFKEGRPDAVTVVKEF